ncbi:MAG: Xaa-Pro peptidase family protein [Clostridia bacterium]|nr:Xaa-Pro peptidase family protein [Clostridia bacterium]
MNTRTKALLNRLPGGAQAALIHNPSNMRYLGGYTGEGLLLISPAICAVVTDFRYIEQANMEAPGYAVHQTSSPTTHNVVAFGLLKEAGVTNVAIEEDTVTHAQYKALVAAMPGINFVALDNVPEALRRVKDEGEIAALEQANGITAKAFDYICGFIRPGVTEKQIAMELERWVQENGADSAAFPIIVASGPNGSLCHATPGPRAVQAGDLITVDFGACVNGYRADMTRTVALGSISAEQRHIYDTVQEAQKRALAAVKPGALCKEVDAVARDYIDAVGYKGRFGHGLGHATGLDIHEEPRFNTTSTGVLEAGMTMTVEPGVYLPGVGGVRIEDSILVTRDGCKVLTPATKELVTIPVG